MTVQFSPAIAAKERGSGMFSVKAIDLESLGERASPIVVLDHFRVRGLPFAPHPHAGFSAVTCVLEDSAAALRSRDSLGNDIVVGPGGIVWTQAGSGVMHHEIPAEADRELHGLQIFVNLSARNKLLPPKMLWLASSEVPERRSEAGDRVRVLAGSFEGLASPLVPAEPLDLLDVTLRRAIGFTLPEDHNALVYVIKGRILLRADGRAQEVASEHAVALHGDGGRVTLAAREAAHVVILSGAEIREPIVVDGPFIMNDRSQVEGAIARYRAGSMGRLEPLS